GDADTILGSLGNDLLCGGTGADLVHGGRGNDLVDGGAGDDDRVVGDYGYDRMDGGPGQGDVASFATDVGAGRGGGVKVSLTRHRARGDGHDRLFRFEDVEGSAFEDILVGNGQANTIDGGPGDDVLRGGGGRDELLGGQGSDRCNGAKGRTASCKREHEPKASAYVELDPAPGGGG